MNPPGAASMLITSDAVMCQDIHKVGLRCMDTSHIEKETHTYIYLTHPSFPVHNLI